MDIDCVFSGGGVKAYAFVGALKSIEQHGLNIKRTAGTSAGAIMASLVASGYSIGELEILIDQLQLEDLIDPPSIIDKLPFMKWMTIYFKLGIYKGNRLEQWLYHVLKKKKIENFSDLKEGALKVIVSDLSLGRLVVIPDDLQDVYGIKASNFSVATAVRMSAGFPYVFMPKYMTGKNKEKSVIVDGGLLSNFPLWVFNDHDRQKRPVLGIKLSESIDNQQPQKITNAIDMMKALVATMKNAHDARYISKAEKKDIIFVPVKDVNTVDFTLSDVEKKHLIELGEHRAEAFLANWPR